MSRLSSKAAKIITASAVIAAAGAVYTHADDSRLSCPKYSVFSDKVRNNIRIAQISDLHGHCYGDGQTELLSAIEKAHPDILVLTGDIFDERVGDSAVYSLIEGIEDKYICFYVSGNHECKSGRLREIKSCLRSHGIAVLEGTCSTVRIGETDIKISGIDDIRIDGRISPGTFASQFSSVQCAASCFSVLLCHRPELEHLYRASSFDLILTGHAHGGQWRLPGVINGLYAPNQGFFPKYAGGEYDLDGTRLIVSRGLQKGTAYLPRIFNRPELVIVDIVQRDKA